MAIDIEEQYEKIYRYCYYRLRNREQAEDVTQETFLRWFASDAYRDKNQSLHYLYTVARKQLRAGAGRASLRDADWCEQRQIQKFVTLWKADFGFSNTNTRPTHMCISNPLK